MLVEDQLVGAGNTPNASVGFSSSPPYWSIGTLVFKGASAAPGAPTNVTATAGNGQATVSWTAPAVVGGSAITGYTVTSSPGGLTPTNNGSTPTAPLTNLVNTTPYTFTVTATNSLGTGPASSPSNSITPPGPPGAPTNINATGGNDQATVSWTAPASNGGSAITGYTVTPYIGTTAQTATTFNSTAT